VNRDARSGPNRLYCHRFGDPARAPLLLLHGFLGCGEDFAPLLGHLGGRFYGLALDLPGHGRTSLDATDPAWSVEGCAETILRWLDAAAIERPHLLGYSMGGRIALRLAVEAPSRFASIVVESASPGLENGSERAQRRQNDSELAARLRRDPLERFVDDWYRQPLFATLRARADYAELRRRRLRQDPHGLARALEQMGVGTQEPLWARLATLARPLHFAFGAEDARYRDIAARLARLAPCLRVRVFAGAGHNVHGEQEQDFAKYLEEVCGERARGTA
jgi:2-succinyl-6-hydroxy-2,4-cyclohexadiene-1-carboxylate synthase